jgi:hypothetical protein
MQLNEGSDLAGRRPRCFFAFKAGFKSPVSLCLVINPCITVAKVLSSKLTPAEIEIELRRFG